MSIKKVIVYAGLGLLTVLGLFFFCHADDEPTAAPVVISSPSPDPSPVVKISPPEAARLLTDFQRAQANEMRALEHRQKMEIKELKSSQSARQKEFESREKNSRHQFFRDHGEGPKRRDFVKDFLERRTVMVSVMKEEKSKRATEQSVYFAAVREDQQTKLKEFKEALARGERPLQVLWPQAGQ